jgi:rhodanese-related sulfurtransferase
MDLSPLSTALASVLPPNAVDALLRQQPDVRLLDVRTPAEFENAHIAGAYNVPLDTLADHAAEIRAAVTHGIVLVCQSGQRARRAEAALAAAGLPQFHVLDGGLAGWIAAGLPVRRGRAKVSLERQVRIAAGALAATSGLLAVLVHPFFGFGAAAIGGGLVFAGVSDTCAMGMLLTRLPYNRAATCDTEAAVRALATGRAPSNGGASA